MKLSKEIYDVYRPLVPFMPENPKEGYGYVPYQVSPDYMDVDDAFWNGTLFKELVTPYQKYLKREV